MFAGRKPPVVLLPAAEKRLNPVGDDDDAAVSATRNEITWS